MISNPPYGKSWSKIKKKVMAVSNGRFDIAQPRTSDGQLLFTLHMLSKMKSPNKGGSSIAIVHNGSPLFSGDAGGGESTIRQYIIENDLLETIVAMPTQLFYNTGIATYVWIIRNNKTADRIGKIQLINAVDFWKPMKRSLGDKRRFMDDHDVQKIVQLHKDYKKGEHSKIYDLDDFAYRKVSIELEELDDEGNLLFEEKELTIAANKLADTFDIKPTDIKQIKNKTDSKAEYQLQLNATSEFAEKHSPRIENVTLLKTTVGNSLKLKAVVSVPVIVKDTEIIPWKTDMTKWLNKEVEKKWTYISENKGYEIPFTREFYVYQPLRQLETVLQEFISHETENTALLNELGLQV